MCDGSVPIAVAARVYGKSPCWVRAGIIGGWLDIGVATYKGRKITPMEAENIKGRINYYISPMKFLNDTGYEWKGEKI